MKEKDKVKRLIELDNKKSRYIKKPSLTTKQRRERERLLDDVVAYYDPKKKQVTTSGGANVILSLKSTFGNWKSLIESIKKQHKHNKPLLGNWLNGIKKIRKVERESGMNLFYNADEDKLFLK